MTWRDARRICVIVRFAVRWNHHAQGTAIRRAARQDWRGWRREGAAAKQSDLGLLITRKRERGIEVRDTSRNQTTVVAPSERNIRSPPLPVFKSILDLGCLLVLLIVIDAEDASRQIGIEEQATAFWRKVPGSRVPG